MSVKMRVALVFFVLAVLAGHYSCQRTTHTNMYTFIQCDALLVQHRFANYSSSEWYFFNTPKYEFGNGTFNNVTGELSFSRPDPAFY